jgi:glutathione synthase/RimK-type ligase-like ATP-grasp enzyme/ribosomal protein S18 acetylase RimI-like enzyme
MSVITIRKADAADLAFLCRLERESFPKDIRSSAHSIKNSINSGKQRVFILEEDRVACAGAVLFIYGDSIRLYSIAVLPEKRGRNFGRQLMDYIIRYANEKYVGCLTLEADLSNPKLIDWYKSFGFETVKVIEHYYGAGRSAVKMKKAVLDKAHIIKNIVVLDTYIDFLKDIDTIEVVTAKEYIVQEKYQKLKGVRVFNLCSSYQYQTMGYYVSLLASARRQRIVPNVATIEDFTDLVIVQSIADDFFSLVQRSLSKHTGTEFTLDIYFGKCLVKGYEKLAEVLYRLFESPFIRFTFKREEATWLLKEVTPLSLEAVEIEKTVLKELAIPYFNQKKFAISKFKNYRYSLAILTDPSEKTPPSCKEALKRFRNAAEKIGFYTEFITKNDYLRLMEFDALFIRATTNVNNFTYLFSRYAYAEGLAVIDDPWSILKCANKIFLAETMKQHGIKTPKTVIVGKDMGYKNLTDDLKFPIILKEPDNAFGLGVFKADDTRSLEEILNRIFEKSEIVLAQEFVKSNFDWRIGVLDNKPLFACKYYMVENHWQIEKWDAAKKNGVVYGKHETFAVEQVPKNVIHAALKASAVMGDGLYGVDLKVVGESVYVIEVNDNPNIDYYVEDKVLKGRLYYEIIHSLYARLEGGSKERYVFQEYKSLEKK